VNGQHQQTECLAACYCRQHPALLQQPLISNSNLAPPRSLIRAPLVPAGMPFQCASQYNSLQAMNSRQDERRRSMPWKCKLPAGPGTPSPPAVFLSMNGWKAAPDRAGSHIVILRLSTNDSSPHQGTVHSLMISLTKRLVFTYI